MELLFAVAFIMFGSVVSMIVYKRYKTFASFHIASLFYIFIYAIVPTFFYLNPPGEVGNKVRYYLSINMYPRVLLLAFFGFIIFTLAYLVGSKLRFKKKASYKDEPVPLRKYNRWAFIAFLLGFLAFLIEVNLQGGIMNSISNIELVRGFKGHAIQDGASNPLVPLRLFKPFMYFSFFTYWLLLKNKKTLVYKFMTALTFLISAFLIFIGGGRTHIIIFLASIAIDFFFSRSRTKKKKKTSSTRKITAAVVLVLLGGIGLVIFDPIFSYLTYGKPMDFTELTTFNSLFTQFSFPFYNVSFTSTSIYGFRFFQDLFVWAVISLPAFITTRIGLPNLSPLYEYNTVLQNGTLVTGGIPNDIITFGMYQMGLLGVAITLISLGVFLSRLDKLIREVKSHSELTPIIFRVVMYMGMIVMYADMEGTFRSRFDVFLLIYLLYDYRMYAKPIVVTEEEIDSQSVKHTKSIIR